MKRKLYLTIGILGTVLAAIFAILLLRRSVLSSSAQSAYEEGDYAHSRERWEEMLSANFPAAYLPWYNLGNTSYEQERYAEAMGYYYEALNHPIPKYKECLVRINLALSIVYQIDFADITTDTDAENAIGGLLIARQILIEDGCAHDADEDGHNADAQQLKDEIDRLLELLQQEDPGMQGREQPPDEPESGEEDSQDDRDDISGMRERQIQEELEQRKQDALEERAEEQDRYNRYYGDSEDEGGYGNERNW